MGLFGLFKKKSDETKVGNVEDFISLTRVYFQSVIATNLGDRKSTRLNSSHIL